MDLILRNRFSDGEMDMPFRLTDSRHDALQVFGFPFYILLGTGNEEFARLHDTAGFVFIGNAHRNDVQLFKILHEVLGAAHIQHLQ